MRVLSKSSGLLNPLDRSAEILFGLIMALTFTCSVSVATTHQVAIRELLISALGCNVAWGLVDAIMFTVGTLARRNRNKAMFEAVRSAPGEEARNMIADAMPPLVASVIDQTGMEQIRQRLVTLPPDTGYAPLRIRDLKKAIAIFFLAFLSTFPVVIPFLVIDDSIVALRTSNGIALAMMFWCGWSVAGYSALNKWLMSSAMVLIGAVLVVITISLGG
jgi:VIT1/CCC1 family predicted Fe2+/Mn2+ transporter